MEHETVIRNTAFSSCAFAPVATPAPSIGSPASDPGRIRVESANSTTITTGVASLGPSDLLRLDDHISSCFIGGKRVRRIDSTGNQVWWQRCLTEVGHVFLRAERAAWSHRRKVI